MDLNTKISGDNNRGGRLGEGEQIEAQADSSNGQLQPSDEDECVDIFDDTSESDAHGEKNKSVQHQNNDENENINSGQEDAVVGNDRNGLPGVMFIAGPDYTGRGIFTGYQSGSDDDTNINEAEVIIQGFLTTFLLT